MRWEVFKKLCLEKTNRKKRSFYLLTKGERKLHDWGITWAPTSSRGLSIYIKVLYTISRILNSLALVFTMNALKKMMAISLSLWLILITPALVGGSRIHSSSKEAAPVGGSGVYGSSKEAVRARGPVPSSSSSSCTHIGIGNGNYRPCPPSTDP